MREVNAGLAALLKEWSDLGDGCVRTIAKPDESWEFDEDDCGEDTTVGGGAMTFAEYRQWVLDRVNRDGAWGVVGEYSMDEGETWHRADSCWGFVCYNDPLDPAENDYAADIMRATIAAYNENLMAAKI